jgi:hypothetical protein
MNRPSEVRLDLNSAVTSERHKAIQGCSARKQSSIGYRSSEESDNLTAVLR